MTTLLSGDASTQKNLLRASSSAFWLLIGVLSSSSWKKCLKFLALLPVQHFKELKLSLLKVAITELDSTNDFFYLSRKTRIAWFLISAKTFGDSLELTLKSDQVITELTWIRIFIFKDEKFHSFYFYYRCLTRVKSHHNSPRCSVV